MNTLLSIRSNIVYKKKEKKNKSDEDQFLKFHELIFLVDDPKYSKTNEDEIIRERGVKELRFFVSSKNFEIMIGNLKVMKDADETEMF